MHDLHKGRGGISRRLTTQPLIVALAVVAATAVSASGPVGAADGLSLDQPLAALEPTTERVSVADDGSQANGSSRSVDISADGRFVAFGSNAPDLVPGGTATFDVYVRDRDLGSTELISVSSAGVPGNSTSGWPSISDDGRYVAFMSIASTLVPDDDNGNADVFVHDRLTAQTRLVSREVDGSPGAGRSEKPDISADGRHVAFVSSAPDLVAGVSGTQAYVHHLDTGTTELLSQTTAGDAGSASVADFPSISSDGGHVVFTSIAQLDPADLDTRPDVFVRDVAAATTSLVSGGISSVASAGDPAISGDGQWVGFDTGFEVFIADLASGDLINTFPNRAIATSRFSADGTTLVFFQRQGSFSFDPYLPRAWNRMTGEVADAGLTYDGRLVVGGSNAPDTFGPPAVSGDARMVGFWADDATVVPGDTNGDFDVFVRDRGDLLGPSVTAIDVAPAVIAPTETVTVTATIDDSSTGGAIVAGAEVRIDAEPWQAVPAADGAFDEVEESIVAELGDAPPGQRQACVRGTDELGNVGPPACAPFEVEPFEDVDVTVTITEVIERGDLDGFLDEPDFYTKIWVGCQQALTGNPFENRDDNVTGEHIEPFWSVTKPVNRNPVFGMMDGEGNFCVQFEIWDADSLSDDDRAELKPSSDPWSFRARLKVDYETGMWSGDAEWPDNCISGSSSDEAVEACFSINLPPPDAWHSGEFTQAIQPILSFPAFQSTLQGDGHPPLRLVERKPSVLRMYFDQPDSEEHYQVRIGDDFVRDAVVDPTCTPQAARDQTPPCDSIDWYFVAGDHPTYAPVELWRLEPATGDTELIRVQHLPVKTIETDRMDINLVSVCDVDTDDGWLCGDPLDVARNGDFARRVIPSPRISYFSGPLIPAVAYDFDFWGKDTWANLTLTEISVVMWGPDWLWDDETTYYHGAVRPESEYCCGIGSLLFNAAMSAMWNSRTQIIGTAEAVPEFNAADTTIAHELGHNLEREHAPPLPADPACSVPEDRDDNWPRPGNPLLEEPGFDVAEGQVMVAALTADLMSYCFPRWPTMYTYRAMMDELEDRLPIDIFSLGSEVASVNAVGDPVPSGAWLARGAVESAGVSWRPLFHADFAASNQPGEGSHRLEVRDDAGAVMFVRRFEPGEAHGTTADLKGLFVEEIPAFDEAAALVVVGPDGSDLGALELTGTPPDISVLPLELGGTPAGKGAVEWTVVDPDSSAHSFRLEYSSDGGETWDVVVAGLIEPRYILDFDSLPGSEETSLLRVRGSDGAQTGTAVSETFFVPRRLPTAEVTQPANAARYEQGELVWLMGAGFDGDDGFLPDESLEWTSDLDGPLGMGSSLPLTALSEGTHLVTLTVTDSDGNTATDAIHVIVAAPSVAGVMPTSGSIAIVKATVPPGGGPFEFSAPGLFAGSIALDDGDLAGFDEVGPGDYEITESAAPGWMVSGIDCVDPDGSTTSDAATATATVRLAAGEHVVCTFTNTASRSDQPPTANAGGPYAGFEGETIAVDGSASTDDHGIAQYEWDCDDDGSVDEATLDPHASCTYPDDGTYTVRLIVTDTAGQSASATAVVEVTNVEPEAVVSPLVQAQQYSDAITPLHVTAVDVPADTPLAAAATWRRHGGATNDGLPPGLNLSALGCAGSGYLGECSWEIDGTVGVPAGTYFLTVAVEDGDGGVGTVESRLDVAPEDALIQADPGNPPAVPVEDSKAGSEAATLRFHLREGTPDITTGPSPIPGDVGNATLSLTLRPIGPGDPATADCALEEVTGAGYDAMATFACEIGGLPANSYEVEAVAGGRYYAGSTATRLAVFDPTFRSARGGGRLPWPGAGKATFAFRAGYVGAAGSAHGNVLLVIRSADGIHWLKARRVSSVAAGAANGIRWAVIEGTGSYRSPSLGSAGGHRFVLYVEDHGPPGSGDRMWLRVEDPAGAPVDLLSLDGPARDEAVELAGGNIVVKWNSRPVGNGTRWAPR